MSFAGWLRATRTARAPEISQKDLAAAAEELDAGTPEGERARFAQSRVSQWERGASLPDLRQLTLLCLALQVTDEERTAGRTAWEAEQLRGLPTDHHDHTSPEAA